MRKKYDSQIKFDYVDFRQNKDVLFTTLATVDYTMQLHNYISRTGVLNQKHLVDRQINKLDQKSCDSQLKTFSDMQN